MPADATTIRVGTDSSKFPESGDHDALWLLRRVHALGLDGVFFRSTRDISPSLDHGELRAAVELADELGLYLEAGTTKVNPFAVPEAADVRELGGGDFVAGFTRIVEASAKAGIHELWAATANYKFGTPGLLGYDRFRTDVSWDEQLAATAKLLCKLEPVLAANGCHLNIETHEEITSFELVRLVEDAGPHAFGITFDTANVLNRGEDPVAAARRVAPYARQSHVRDGALFADETGAYRFLAPCGEGVIDWPGLLRALLEGGSERLTLSIEGIMWGRWQMPVPYLDPDWGPGHPDLDESELERFAALVREHGQRVARGERPGPEHYRAKPTLAERTAFVTESVAFLRTTLAELSGVAA
ncbi:MAG: sugar phosphate isomerase/epimerase [Nocardioidaceae bacterium]|nr:sugar phosphate isomerase/epimerase [Nocardioidaceae bacterium]